MSDEDRDYTAMRGELMLAVAHICRQCTEPQVPVTELNFSEPDKCPCRCERTRGMLEAIVGMG